MRNSYYRVAVHAMDIRARWQSAIDVEHSRESVENGGIPTSNIASGQSVNLSHPLFLNSCYQIRAVGEDISNHLPCTISWRKLSSAPGRNPSYILFHDAKQTSTKDPRNSLIQACGLKRKRENSEHKLFARPCDASVRMSLNNLRSEADDVNNIVTLRFLVTFNRKNLLS